MPPKIVKSTDKGQITLPKQWRDQFKTNYFILQPDQYVITIKPISLENQEEVIFDADRDNNGKGVSVDEMINLLKKIKDE